MSKKTGAALLLSCVLFFLTPLHYEAKEPLTYFPIVKKGEVVEWDKVNTLLPKGSTFKVIDLETGFYFEVQRRAGNRHADVQPLTRDDTEVLKHLYNGKWSWKRRAILIPINGKMIAASMHGMPHGRGALPNGFPGHFCIHFAGSTTHRSRNIDPSHQLMIQKAGGQLDNYVTNANARQLVTMFLVGMKQEDFKIAAPALNEQLLKDKDIYSYFKNVSSMQFEIRKKTKRYPPIVHTEIPVKVKLLNANGKQNLQLIFILDRKSMTDGWKITRIKGLS